MSRVAVAGRASAVLTAARGPSLYAVANSRIAVREVGIFNASTSALAVAVARVTSTGTQGAALTEVPFDDDSVTVQGTAFNTHTADATVSAPVRQGHLGAAAGSGVIWTFGGSGLQLDNSTNDGFIIFCPAGSGQLVDFYIEWDE